MKVRLSKRVIDEANYEGPGGCYLWDSQMPGFGVRIYPSGTKSFVVNYWSKGRRRFYTIGRYGKITLHQAKEDALRLFLKVHKGEDPAADRKATKSQPTVADLADRHIQDHAKLKNKARSVKRSRRSWDRCVLPTLGKRYVKDITRADIAKLMTSMSETPAMANKVQTLLAGSAGPLTLHGTQSIRGVPEITDRPDVGYRHAFLVAIDCQDHCVVFGNYLLETRDLLQTAKEDLPFSPASKHCTGNFDLGGHSLKTSAP